MQIAIVGGGNVLPSHEDLGAKTTIKTRGQVGDKPFDPIPYDNQPFIATGAGGMAAALTDNNTGIAGVDWNASILSYNPAVLETAGGVSPPFQTLNIDAVDDELIQAANDGADVLLAPITVFKDDPAVNFETTVSNELVDLPGGISLPVQVVDIGEGIIGYLRETFGYSSEWNQMHNALASVVASGRPVITPVGDFDGSAYTFPASTARHRMAISVGSTDESGNPSQYSGSSLSSSPDNTSLDVVAPGENVLTTVNTNSSAYSSVKTGTASAGLVTGVASLFRAYDPYMTPDDIREVLRRTGEDIGDPGFDTKTGFGLIDAQAAFDYMEERDFVRGVATNGSAQKIYEDKEVELVRGPWGTLPSGVYFADIYKVTFTVDLPTGSDYDAWVFNGGTKGWSVSNPNNEDQWGNIEVDLYGSEATITTYVYGDIHDIRGRSVSEWEPVSPQNAQVAYTVAVKPGTPPPLPYPKNFRITNRGQVGASVRMEWDAAPYASSYDVYRDRSDTFGGYQKIGSTTMTAYIDDETKVGGYNSTESAVYYVKAVSEYGESPASSVDGTAIQGGSSYARLEPPAAAPAVPDTFALRGNVPNPVGDQTTIRYAVPEAADVSLVVYDVMGREVARPVEGTVPVGFHEVQVEASQLPSGVYFYRLTAGAFTETRRLVIVK
jgi:hypothetical protein